MYYCSSCGQVGDGRFCRICGNSLIAVPDQTPTGQSAMMTPTQVTSPVGEAGPQPYGGGVFQPAGESTQLPPPSADPLLYGGGRRRGAAEQVNRAADALGAGGEPLLYGGGTSRHAAAPSGGVGPGVASGAVPGSAEPTQALPSPSPRGSVFYGGASTPSAPAGAGLLPGAADSTQLLPPSAAGNPLLYGGAGVLPGAAESTQLLPPSAQNDPQLYGGAPRYPQQVVPDRTQLLPPTAAAPVMPGALGVPGAPATPAGYWAASPAPAPPSAPAPAPRPAAQVPQPSFDQLYQQQPWPPAVPSAPVAGGPYGPGPAGFAGPQMQGVPGQQPLPAFGGQPVSVQQPPAPPNEYTQDWESGDDPDGQPKVVLYGVLGAVAIAVAVIGGLLYFGTPSGPSTTPTASGSSQPASAVATPTKTSGSQLQLPPPPPTTAPPTTAAPTVPAAPTGAITGYQGMCVDDRSGGTTNSNPVLVASCDNSADQTWSVASGNTLQIFGMCLDVNGAGTSDGTTIDLYTCNGTGAQVWEPQANGSLFNPMSGKCLDDTAFGGPGTQLQIWDCGGGPNQKWALP